MVLAVVDHLLNTPVILMKPAAEPRYGEPAVPPVEVQLVCRASDVQVTDSVLPQGNRPIVKRRFYFNPDAPITATDQIACDNITYRIVSVASIRDLIGKVHHLQVDGIGVAL